MCYLSHFFTVQLISVQADAGSEFSEITALHTAVIKKMFRNGLKGSLLGLQLRQITFTFVVLLLEIDVLNYRNNLDLILIHK